MIPVKLTLKGIYSYRDEQTIDFRPLIDSGLFGIFGGVGSGKSTILEAITFALYRKTERLSRNDSPNYNMMNLKSDELKVDFEFRNHQNEAWRFIVEGKRNGNNFESINLKPSRVFKYIDGEWSGVDHVDAVEVVGMSYDNFRRTIIIPQGQFKEFLELGSTDRTKMLEEIFSLHRFEFQREAKALYADAVNRLSGMEGELLQYEGIDKEAITHKKEEAQKLQDEFETARKQRDAEQHRAEQLRQLWKKVQRRDELQKKQQELSATRLENERKEARLQEYESCRDQFSEVLKEADRLDKARRKKEEALKNALERESHKKQQLESLLHKKQQYAENFAQREQMIDRIREYDVLLKLNDAGKRRKTAEESLQQLNSSTSAAAEALAASQEKKQIKREGIKALRTQQPDESHLYELKSWFSTYDSLRADIKRTTKEKEGVKESIEQQLAALAAKLKSLDSAPEVSLNPDAVQNPESAVSQLQAAWKRLTKERDELQQKLTEHKAHQKLEQAVQQLEEGKPCPLCGATHHPEPLETASLNSGIQASEKQLNRLRTLIEQLNTLIQDSRLIDVEVKRLYAEQARLSQDLSDKKQQAEQQLDTFSWPDFSPEQPEKVEKEQARVAGIKKEIAKKEAELDQLEREIGSVEAQLQKDRERLDQLKEERTRFRTAEEGFRQQLEQLDPQQYAEKGSDAITLEKNKLQKRLEELDKMHQQLQKEEQELNIAVAKSAEEIKLTREALSVLETEIGANNTSFSQKLKESEFESYSHIRELLESPPDIAGIREEIRKFNELWTEIKVELQSLKEELGERTLTQKEVGEAEQAALELSQRCEYLLKENDAALREVKRLEEAFRKKLEKEKEKKQLEQRVEHLKTMLSLFKARGFVNYISSVYLRQLCNTANARFHKLTNQQLKLELDDKNNFRVRDFLNEGRQRNIKTLSGGQTFQASLCLALALAESVQFRSKTPQHFFFLDEGFGTLDQETLRIVFETLKSLRKENRVIGVISHVEALQQQIDVNLTIRNTDEAGSVVHRSWQS